MISNWGDFLWTIVEEKIILELEPFIVFYAYGDRENHLKINVNGLKNGLKLEKMWHLENIENIEMGIKYTLQNLILK